MLESFFLLAFFFLLAVFFQPKPKAVLPPRHRPMRQCRYGATCKSLFGGSLCTFDHSHPILPPAPCPMLPCRYGSQCKSLQAGGRPCKFEHTQPVLPPAVHMHAPALVPHVLPPVPRMLAPVPHVLAPVQRCISSGVILVQRKYRNNTGCSDAMFLFLNKKGGKLVWELGYGKCDGDLAENAASRELYEESACMFNIDKDLLAESMSVSSRDKKHTAFFLQFEGHCTQKIYSANKLYLTGLPSSYHETMGITRVSINAFVCSDIMNWRKNPARENFRVANVDNIMCDVAKRDADFIHDAIYAGLPQKAHVHRIKLVKNTRVPNTSTYVLG
jgi:hypothetical protein